jgi:hypothetical protein
VSDYPDEVAQVFRQLRFPEVLPDDGVPAYRPQSWKDVVSWITCGTIAVVIVALIVLGVMKLREMIR